MDKNIIGFSTGNGYLDGALYNYLIHGIKPGGFLTSVLANDLIMAASRADHWNKDQLCEIVNVIVYNAPEASYGSYRVVGDWCRDVNRVRTQYADQIQKQYVMRVLKQEHNKQDIYNEPPF